MDGDSSSSIGAGRASRAEIDLALDDPSWREDMPEVEAIARRAAHAALDAVCPGTHVAMALVLADDSRLHELNRDWRGVDKATNVLSFPAEAFTPGEAPTAPPGQPPGAPVELGDVIVARGVTRREADEADRPVASHLSHLVVHGTLHLLGYDHEDDEEAEVMEAMERKVLARLGIPDPYA